MLGMSQEFVIGTHFLFYRDINVMHLHNKVYYCEVKGKCSKVLKCIVKYKLEKFHVLVYLLLVAQIQLGVCLKSLSDL